MAKSKRTADPKPVFRTLSSYDDYVDYLHYQQVALTPAQAAWPLVRADYLSGLASRTKAQRAFRRAFPGTCTEAFDGVCRCR